MGRGALTTEAREHILTARMNSRELIESAFAPVGYPGDKNLVKCSCTVCRHVFDHFKSTTWRDHTLEQLQQHQLALCQFTPEAFQYFLPAFLLRSQGAWLDTCLIPFFITKQILPPQPDDTVHKKKFRAELMELLTISQKQALIAYLNEYAMSGTALIREDVTMAVAHLEEQLRSSGLGRR
jgi:hypothetical protein